MNDTFYNLSSGFESLIKTLPEKFIWQYRIVLRGGFPEHIWILSSDKGAVHISARPSEWEKRFKWIGGIECHWTEPPEWADAEKPSHDHCWILGKPCWHDVNADLSGEDYASAAWKDGDQKEITALLENTFREWLTAKGYQHAWALNLFESDDVPATEAFYIWEETGKWPDMPTPSTTNR